MYMGTAESTMLPAAKQTPTRTSDVTAMGNKDFVENTSINFDVHGKL